MAWRKLRVATKGGRSQGGRRRPAALWLGRTAVSRGEELAWHESSFKLHAFLWAIGHAIAAAMEDAEATTVQAEWALWAQLRQDVHMKLEYLPMMQAGRCAAAHLADRKRSGRLPRPRPSLQPALPCAGSDAVARYHVVRLRQQPRRAHGLGVDFTTRETLPSSVKCVVLLIRSPPPHADPSLVDMLHLARRNQHEVGEGELCT